MDNGTSGSAVDSFQASPQQEQIWTTEPDGPAARVQVEVAIDGRIEASAVADALRLAVGRHESLRTTFSRQAGLRVPPQTVNESLEPLIETLDLSAAGPEERAERLEQARLSELAAVLDLDRGPLVRAILAIAGDRAMRLILTIAALCIDPGSTALLVAEMVATLGSGELVEDPLQYADFSAWQHELRDSEESEADVARASWEELAAVRSPALPFARRTDAAATVQELAIEIDEPLARALADIAGRYGTTVPALVQAAWHAVLGRFSAEERTAVAFLASERRHDDLEGALGAFARPVPIQTRVGAARTFAEVLADLARAREDALVMQDYAPDGVLEDVEIGFVEYPPCLNQPEGLRLTIERMLYARPDLPMLLVCGADAGRLGLTLVFDRGRHDLETVRGLANGLQRMLAGAASDPGVALADVELLHGEERRRVLHEFNDTAVTAPRETAHQLIARWALSAPDRPAAVDGTSSITYAELDARANQLAHHLRGLGVGPGIAVGLCTDRSIEMVVGLLGILKSGGVYVPLHHEHPAARLRHQLVTAGARVLVTQELLLGELPEIEGEVVCLDRDRQALDREPSTAPESGAGPEDLAYLIFTSGSTGAPKGVSVTHANLVNYATDIVRRVGADAEPLSFGLVTSVSTDLGNTSVFGALCSGGTLVLFSPNAASDPGEFARQMESTAVDVLKITPSHLGALLAAADARVLPKRRLVLGGERAGWDLIERVRGLSGCAILNHYGPTETTIGSCTFDVGDGPGEYEPASVPIGRPIANTYCYVLDEQHHPAPVGVPGRLFIAGAGVARGYVGEPELTAERFSADPFLPADGAQTPSAANHMYDTGDLARWLPDGNLEFLGRADQQVKIRGYRVEPAEVDEALRRHPQLRESITVARAGSSGELQLVCFYVADATIATDELRRHLSDWLPDYMLPAALVALEQLPRTPSGKIDVQSLPDADAAKQEVERVAPRSPLEQAVAEIWSQTLGEPDIGVEDDFFSLGGHSLLATQVVAQVRSNFAVDLPLHSLFTYPTVSSLTEEIVRMMGDSEVEETARMMAELDEMSDEEAQRLLASELGHFDGTAS
jgi:amino acid adenylation domain-containing protein